MLDWVIEALGWGAVFAGVAGILHMAYLNWATGDEWQLKGDDDRIDVLSTRNRLFLRYLTLAGSLLVLQSLTAWAVL